jgi:hypothetical protein
LACGIIEAPIPEKWAEDSDQSSGSGDAIDQDETESRVQKKKQEKPRKDVSTSR